MASSTISTPKKPTAKLMDDSSSDAMWALPPGRTVQQFVPVTLFIMFNCPIWSLPVLRYKIQLTLLYQMSMNVHACASPPHAKP